MVVAPIALGLLAVLAVLIYGWVVLLRSCLLGHAYVRDEGLTKTCRKCGRCTCLFADG